MISPQRNKSHSHSRPTEAGRRSGVVTFWAIVTIPIFLIMLCMVLEIGNLWMGRIQLKNALEAAALAGARSWGDAGGGDTTVHRGVANAYASANVINGTPVDLTLIDATLNDTGANTDNDNASCAGVLVFGATTTNGSNEFVFNAATTDACGLNGSPLTTFFAVRAQATVEVPSICDTIFGFAVGNFNVTARVDALYDCSGGNPGQPRIYHLDQDLTNPLTDNYLCP